MVRSAWEKLGRDMKSRVVIMLAVVVAAAVSSAEADEPRRGQAAACVACARSCPGPCVPQGEGCVCPQNALYDCYTACERQGVADRAALDGCRKRCHTPAPR